MHDVITIGAATRDVFLVSKQFQLLPSTQFETGMGECVALGAKIDVDKLVLTTGGGATNAATTFARLGFKTAVLCRVGDDGSGRDLLEELKRDGVATRFVTRVRGSMTGYSTILMAPNGERTVLVHRGASAMFTGSDIPASLASKWTYLTSVGGNLSVLKRIFAMAKKSGSLVAWNPGHGEIERGFSAIRPLLAQTRVFNLNREEAAALTKKETIADMFDALGMPSNVVVITDGERGAYAHANGQTLFIPTRPVKAVSRTGAGDAFGSGFVAGFAKTQDVKTAMALGLLNAESVIGHIGAKAGILPKWPSNRNINIVRATIR